MRREIKENVFTHKRRKIDSLRSMQFGVEGKRRDSDFVNKFFQTGDAAEFDRLP